MVLATTGTEKNISKGAAAVNAFVLPYNANIRKKQTKNTKIGVGIRESHIFLCIIVVQLS